MLTRRQLLKAGALAGVAVALPVRWRWPSLARAASGILDPTTIPKYGTPLVIPPAMPVTSLLSEHGQPVRYYEIAVRQFSQQILPAGLPASTVWSYGSVGQPETFNYPAFTVEAPYGRSGSTASWMERAITCPICYRSIRLSTGPTHREVSTGATAVPRSARRPFGTPARCQSSPTSMAATPATRATASPRPGTCLAPGTSRRDSRGSAATISPSAPSSSASTARPGRRATLYSSTTTTSRHRHSGITTTPWA